MTKIKTSGLTRLFFASLFICGAVLAIGLNINTGTAKAVEGETEYTATNSDLNGDEGSTDAVDIGFTFNYNGVDYNSAFININGMLNFDQAYDPAYSVQQLPADYGASIMPFWSDMITKPQSVTCEGGYCDWEGNYSTIYHTTVGTPGSRKFIVQWTDMRFYDNPEISMGTFQLILYEGTNVIQFQYRNLSGDDMSLGSYATVGLNFDAENAMQYFYNFGSLDNGQISQEQAISFTPGVGYTMDDNAAYDPVYLTVTGQPDAPILTNPENSGTYPRKPMFGWGAVESADTYRLQVSDKEDFSNLVIDQFGLTDAGYYDNITPLEANTTYYWRVEAFNDIGSNMSETWTFTTNNQMTTLSDDDGIGDDVESSAPNSGDANNDGILDFAQQNVASLVDPVTTKYTSVETMGSDPIINVSIAAASQNEVKDTGYNYPAGMIDFSINCSAPGSTSTITLYFYGVNATNLVLRKYNETTKTYTTVSGATITNVVIGGQNAVKAVYQVTDGSSMDDDGLVNGVIVDPVGLAELIPGAPDTGRQSVSLLPIAIIIITGITLVGFALRRS